MKLFCGDNVNFLKTLDENSIDSIVTDPPYGLKFMGKKWDHSVPTLWFWRECFRVLKPGGHVLSFGGTRTYHRMAVNIEDAGFEIRDQIMWLYGSGFPKSQNISKMIDKKFGREREVVGTKIEHNIKSGNGNESRLHNSSGNRETVEVEISKPSSDQAKQWDGFGTALKPANEPIVLARKPLSEKTIVDNVLKWGTGGLNIDGCRVGLSSQDSEKLKAWTEKYANGTYKELGWKNTSSEGLKTDFNEQGRWPANVILDEEAGEMLDAQSGVLKSGKKTKNFEAAKTQGVTWKFGGGGCEASKGGASRFFYCAKASKKERNAGLEGLEEKNVLFNDTRFKNNGDGTIRPITQTQNHHPTVKPIKLMEYLIKLITPPGGVVLDPFMGSGSTGVAAKNLGFDFVGMELDEQYFEIAKQRIK